MQIKNLTIFYLQVNLKLSIKYWYGIFIQIFQFKFATESALFQCNLQEAIL
jgi:hypothetical protein